MTKTGSSKVWRAHRYRRQKQIRSIIRCLVSTMMRALFSSRLGGTSSATAKSGRHTSE